jgi:beta-lactamase regulating signal transducer with metallopeptidase domain
MGDSLAQSVSLDAVAAIGTSLLLGSAIKALVLLAAVGVIAQWLRGASAAMRHLLWFCAIAGLAAIPVLGLVLPGWDVLPSWVEMPAGPDRTPVAASIELGQPSGGGSMLNPSTDGGQDQSVSENAIVPPAHERVMPANDVSWRLVVLIVWISGCVVSLVPVLAGTVSLLRLERQSQRTDGSPIDSAARRVAKRLGVTSRVRVLTSEQRSMPMLWGVLWPRVLIPAAAREWSAQRIEAVLTHEFAHLRRHDCLTQMTARLACAFYWYHPLVWWSARRMRAEGELACDDLVLRSGCRAPDYAEHLLHVAAGAQTGLPLGSTVIGMAWRSRLEVRLRAILDDGRNRLGPTCCSAAGCMVLVGSLAYPLAVLRSEPPTERAVDGPVAAENPFLAPPIAVRKGLGALPVRLSYVDNTSEGVRSIAGSGHAVKYRRPADGKYLMAVEIFAHRYGHFTAPAEDFHVYVLDEKRKLIQALPFPYSRIEWGFPRWYTLALPAVEVPGEYYVALAFNPHRTKGIYLGLDESVERSHSYIGRPTTGFEPVGEKFDWMVRSVLVGEIPENNPFASQDE